jgi:hypothetical protein
MLRRWLGDRHNPYADLSDETLVRQRICLPLGMPDTITPSDQQPPRRSTASSTPPTSGAAWR